jgi:phasin family protein
MTAEARKTMEEGVEKIAKSFETAAAFNQDNFEAFVTSSKIAAKAAESVSGEIIAYSKKSYEEGMAAAKELSACTTMGEFFEKQSEFGKLSMEGFVAEASRLNDMYAAAAKEAFAPLTARFNKAVEIARDFRV